MQSIFQLIGLYTKLHHIHLDPAQLTHQFAGYAGQEAVSRVATADVLRILQQLGFDTKLHTGAAKAISQLVLPALMPTRDGKWMLVRKMETGGPTGVVVLQQAGDSTPRQVTLAEFDTLFAGEWIVAQLLDTMRGTTASQGGSDTGRFGVGRFWHSLKKYKLLMAGTDEKN